MSDYDGKVTDELRQIYADAAKEGIWVREFGCQPGNDVWLAAAGEMSILEEIEEKTGQEIDIDNLSLGECFHVSMPGTGKTREEACREAIRALKDSLAGLL